MMQQCCVLAMGILALDYFNFKRKRMFPRKLIRK